MERYDHKIVGLEVELFHERNRRQLKNCQRVEITGRGCRPGRPGRGLRGRSSNSALDAAIAKLEARMRRSHDRRRITARRSTVLVGRGSGGQHPAAGRAGRRRRRRRGARSARRAGCRARNSPRSDERLGRFRRRRMISPDDRRPSSTNTVPGRIVRRKVHTAHPMSVDDALSRMELVGHDFYLFSDSETRRTVGRLPAQGLRLRGDLPIALTQRGPVGVAMGPRCGFATLVGQGTGARRPVLQVNPDPTGR